MQWPMAAIISIGEKQSVAAESRRPVIACESQCNGEANIVSMAILSVTVVIW